MAKEKKVRDKFDLDTLTRKVKPFLSDGGLIENWIDGCEIALDGDDYKEVIPYKWFIDNQTNEVHLEFTDGTDGSFSLSDKFFVRIDIRYLSITSKMKRKRKRN
jgi:hypothetical protein